jgi:regulator of replication initiation timing
MPEETFPKKLYHENYGVIEADSQETMDLALSRGFKRVPPALNTIPKLKDRIVEVEAELKELKENLKAKIHENEVAMKAEEILEKMRADTAKKDAEAQAKAEKQAAKDALEAEKKAAADAKAAAEAEVGSAPAAPKGVEFGEKGKNK